MARRRRVSLWVAVVAGAGGLLRAPAPFAPPASVRRRPRGDATALGAAAPSADEEGMVETLERLYGRPTLVGDLDAVGARALYLSLLPRVLARPTPPAPLARRDRPRSRAARKRRADAVQDYRRAKRNEVLLDDAQLRSRAVAAAVARRAAKRYARNRSWLVLRGAAHAGDAGRYFYKTGRFSIYGATTEELVERYVDAARAEAFAAWAGSSEAAWAGSSRPFPGSPSGAPRRVDAAAARDREVNATRRAYETVLEKSVSTNELLDRLLTAAPETAEAEDVAGPTGRARRRERAEAFWRAFPLRPSVLFAAVSPAKTPRAQVVDDTADVWDAFLLRCVEPVGAPATTGEARGAVFATAKSRAKWSARNLRRRRRRLFGPSALFGRRGDAKTTLTIDPPLL